MKKFPLVAMMLFAGFLTACGDQANTPLNEVQKKEVQDMVRQVLADDPKLVMDALQAFQQKSRVEAAENTKKAIQSAANEIYNNPASPIMGNPNGDITVVEFFDYNCGYCKAVFHPVRDAVLQDGNIKFVFKDYPILGESSVLAAKAALAASRQGKYVEFHTALMDFRGNKDDAAMADIAGKLGLNVGQFKSDINNPEIQQQLAADIALGQKLGVNGTPAFIVGDKFYPGALDADSFKKLVQDFRAAKGSAPAPAAAPVPAPAQEAPK